MLFFRNILPALILTFSISCNDSGTEPLTDGEMIKNGSFEFNDIPSLEWWELGNRDFAELVNDAPPEGGNWSLRLTSDGSPTSSYAYTNVSGVKSGDVLLLSAYIKAGGFDGGGSIDLRTGQFFTITETDKSVSSGDTSWTQISLVDTIDLNSGDSVWVVLSSLHTQITQRSGLFDLVKIERTGSR
jgi:hypothetical protein